MTNTGDPVVCYAVPGMGATGEIFQNLQFSDFIDLQVILWVKEQPGETLADYAARLIDQVDQSRPYVLIGFSLGAALVVEMAKIGRPALVIVVSGIVTGDCVPARLKWLKAFGLHNFAFLAGITPDFLLRVGCGVAFGIAGDRVALDTLVPMAQKTSPAFYRWAIKALATWDNSQRPENLFAIHGDKDRMLPMHCARPDYVIPGGGHFIVFTHGPQLAARMEQEIRRRCLDEFPL